MKDQHSKKISSFSQLFKYIYERLIKPNSQNEDIARVEYILNIILLASVALTTATFFQSVKSTIIQGDLYGGIPALVMCLILLLFVGLLVISRMGFVKSASFAVVMLYFLPISYGIYYFGVDQPQTLLSYAIVVVLAGVIVGTRFAFAITLLITFVILFFGIMQINGTHLPHTYWKQEESGFVDIIIFAITFSILAIISWLSNREIEKALFRARAAEKELLKERDSLEIKVKERTRELERLQFEKTKQMQSLVDFGRNASGLFHDMTNPLQAAILSVYNLKKSVNINDRAGLNNALDEVMEQMEKTREFINAAKSQIATHDICINFDPEEQIALVFQMLSFGAKRDNVKLLYVHNKSKLLLRGNPLSFYRLLAGLVSNAIDAYEGVVSENESMRTVTVASECRGNHFILSVEDNGKGISKENQMKIFDLPFTTKGIEKGTGVGLIVCKEKVEKDFSGEISFKSEENRGAVFTVSLPVRNK